ncbi:MAG: tRNA pseudouridine(55) synthase TruB [Candidatus Sulfotelmatobacter sp.]
MNGVLIIDKPAGLTSHDVVNRVRRILGQRSVGHLGTLDPMAVGVLPLVTGNFTRLAQFYISSEKTYEGTVRFGFCTDTYDAEGEPTSEPTNVTLNPDELESAAAKFRGLIEQTPPPFSAKKIKGVPAYKLARKQKEVTLQPVQVEIKELEVLGVDVDRMRFRARVSSGTYLRSVAHDLGKALGCGAHLETLRRTSVAEFSIAEAHTLEELTASAGKSAGFSGARAPEGASLQVGNAVGVAERLSEESGTMTTTAPSPEDLKVFHELFIHPRKLLPQMPCITADELTAGRIRAGRTVNLPELSRARQVKVFVGQRDLIAIATRIAGTLFHPRIVLCGT